MGRKESHRYRRLGAPLGVRSVHTRLHRDSPSTWLPGSRRRRGLEIFRGKMATTAFSSGASLEGTENLSRVTVEGEGCLCRIRAFGGFGFEAGLCQVALCHVAACS